MVVLRILVGLARAVRRQIGNTGLGGCNIRPLEKSTAFKFCVVSAALNREHSFFLETRSTNELRQTKCNIQTFFGNTIFLPVFDFGFKSSIIVLGSFSLR